MTTPKRSRKDKGKEKVTVPRHPQRQSLSERRRNAAAVGEIRVPMDDEVEKEEGKEYEGYVSCASDRWRTGSGEELATESEVWTIFFQGANTSQLQLARYTGDWGFETTTGEVFHKSDGMEAIRFPFVGVEVADVVFPEVTPQGYYKWVYGGSEGGWPGGAMPCVSELPTLCCHPLLWIGHNFSDITQELFGLRAAPSGCCLPYGQTKVGSMTTDKGVRLTAQNFALRMDRINLGQQSDLDTHRSKWELLQRQLFFVDTHQAAMLDPDVAAATREGTQEEEEEAEKHKPHAENVDGKVSSTSPMPENPYPCILYGVSRGAAVTLNAMAAHKYHNVRLIVLEGCYDNLRGVMVRRYGRVWTPMVEFLLGMITEYRPGELNPMDAISKISNEVPIGFVTSRGDQFVPPSVAERLVQALRKNGHERVHLLRLQHARHGNYTHGGRLDTLAYTQWLHALYKQYGLPHVPEYAKMGRDLLDDSKGGGQEKWFREHDFQTLSRVPSTAKTKEGGGGGGIAS